MLPAWPHPTIAVGGIRPGFGFWRRLSMNDPPTVLVVLPEGDRLPFHKVSEHEAFAAAVEKVGLDLRSELEPINDLWLEILPISSWIIDSNHVGRQLIRGQPDSNELFIALDPRGAPGFVLVAVECE